MPLDPDATNAVLLCLRSYRPGEYPCEFSPSMSSPASPRTYKRVRIYFRNGQNGSPCRSGGATRALKLGVILNLIESNQQEKELVLDVSLTTAGDVTCLVRPAVLPVFAKKTWNSNSAVVAAQPWKNLHLLLCGNQKSEFYMMLPTFAPKCFRNAFNRHTAPTIIRHQQRGASNENKPPSKNSSIFTTSNNDRSTLKIPDFSKYSSKGNPRSNQVFSYFMAGSLGLASAVGAKATVQDFLVNMSASADVLAQAKVEMGIGAIPEGKNAIIKWRGKPVFIRHRTQEEIKEAQQIDWKNLRDPEPDEDRVKKPEWLVMIGVCTHLGCVPIGEAGEYGGWFCPCHGSHYDISGRARKGPAPINLEVPVYDFPSEDTLVIG